MEQDKQNMTAEELVAKFEESLKTLSKEEQESFVKEMNSILTDYEKDLAAVEEELDLIDKSI